MIPAFAAARSRQAPRADAEVIRHLRRQQSFRKLPLRLRQALGKAA
jgi:hypothetical protein